MHRVALPTAIVALATLLAACSSSGASASPSMATTPAASDPASTQIEVTLTDALKIEPGAITVPAGVPVTFVVTNAGSIEHEFYLGDEAAQAAHEEEMKSMGGMTHDEPEGISVPAGETKQLTYTFDTPGTTLAGCHLPGHYAGGMKAEITVED